MFVGTELPKKSAHFPQLMKANWILVSGIEEAIEQAFLKPIDWIIFSESTLPDDRQKFQAISDCLAWEIELLVAENSWQQQLQAAIQKKREANKIDFRYHDGLIDAQKLPINFN